MACGTRYNLAQIQALLRETGWSDIAVNSKSGRVPLIALMSAVFLAESSGCSAVIGTLAHNEYSVGICQVNTRVHKNYSVRELTNPQTNLSECLRIYRQQGLNAWGSYYDNRYKRYLPEALRIYQSGGQGNEQSNLVDTPTASINNNVLALGVAGLVLLYFIW